MYSMPNGTDVWYELEKVTGQFLTNIVYLSQVNITMDGLDLWVDPIFQSLQTLQSPSLDRYAVW